MKVGQKVYREVYLDDGTWNRKGDKCLVNSPLKYGTIKSYDTNHKTYKVQWEDGKIGDYYEHGITKSS